MSRQVPQFFSDVWRHRSQQLHHRLQRLAKRSAASHRLVLLLDQCVVALHQRGQGRVEVEIAQVLGHPFNGLVAQALNGLAFAGFGPVYLALNPVIVDDAPEAVQEAPDTF